MVGEEPLRLSHKVKSTFHCGRWKALSHLRLGVTEPHAGNGTTVRSSTAIPRVWTLLCWHSLPWGNLVFMLGADSCRNLGGKKNRAMLRLLREPLPQTEAPLLWGRVWMPPGPALKPSLLVLVPGLGHGLHIAPLFHPSSMKITRCLFPLLIRVGAALLQEVSSTTGHSCGWKAWGEQPLPCATFRCHRLWDFQSWCSSAEDQEGLKLSCSEKTGPHITNAGICPSGEEGPLQRILPWAREWKGSNVWEAEVQISRIKLKENKQIRKRCFGFSQEPRTVNRGGGKANIFYPGGTDFVWAKEGRNEYKIKSKDESHILQAQTATAIIGSLHITFYSIPHLLPPYFLSPHFSADSSHTRLALHK